MGNQVLQGDRAGFISARVEVNCCINGDIDQGNNEAAPVCSPGEHPYRLGRARSLMGDAQGT